jgi:hypothetical protein
LPAANANGRGGVRPNSQRQLDPDVVKEGGLTKSDPSSINDTVELRLPGSQSQARRSGAPRLKHVVTGERANPACALTRSNTPGPVHAGVNLTTGRPLIIVTPNKPWAQPKITSHTFQRVLRKLLWRRHESANLLASIKIVGTTGSKIISSSGMSTVPGERVRSAVYPVQLDARQS